MVKSLIIINHALILVETNLLVSIKRPFRKFVSVKIKLQFYATVTNSLWIKSTQSAQYPQNVFSPSTKARSWRVAPTTFIGSLQFHWAILQTNNRPTWRSLLLAKRRVSGVVSFFIVLFSPKKVWIVICKMYKDLLHDCFILFFSRPQSYRVGHTMDVLSPFISVVCNSAWLLIQIYFIWFIRMR